MRRLAVLALLLAACLQAASSNAPLGPSARISLLTCASGQEIWTHYGHTAIRVEDPDRHLDLCFNYGLFRFDTPNFIGRFISGQTDYMLGYCRSASFIEEYRQEQRSITQQTLNLSPQERQALWQALQENAKKENRTYRYNFFYDNCATRARRIIENNIDGQVRYDSVALYPSLRASLKHYTAMHPWADFGISLLIASEADRPANFETLLYAPGEMQIAFQTAVIQKGDSVRPLVADCHQVLDFQGSQTASSLDDNYPKNEVFDIVMLLSAAVLALNLVLMAWESRRRKRCYLADILLYALAGLAGIILVYLALFSEHPAVHCNWLILWLHPLQLLYALALCIPAVRRQKWTAVYPKINSLLCLVMLIGAIAAPQAIHPAIWPLVAVFVLRQLLLKTR